MGDLRFDGEVAVVTGAGGGIGRSHALALAARGAAVVVNDASAARAGKVVAEIEAAGGQAMADDHRVGSTLHADALVDRALDRFGRLDILLANAGTGGPAGPFPAIDDEALDTIVGTHLLGTFRLCRAAWPHLAVVGGRICTTTSMSFVGATGMAAYAMAKGGIVSLTRALAAEGAEVGLRANAIAPIAYTHGATLTPDPAVREWMARAFPSELTTPAVIWLVHRNCVVNGEVVLSAGGRVALIETTSAAGLQLGGELTPELVRERWAEIVDRTGAVAVRHNRDDMALFSGEQAWCP